MHDPMTFESRLADAYDRWASEMPTDVDAVGLVRATRARDSGRRRAWFARRMRVALLLALLGALALAAALLVASRETDDPPPPAAAYQVVVARTVGDRLRIIAVQGDGRERVLTAQALTPTSTGRGDREVDLTLSSTGWLAIRETGDWRLIDLRDPTRVVDPIPNMSDARGQSWTPDGRFAQWLESGAMRLTDPESGTTTMLQVSAPTYDIDAWTADGSGFIQGGDGPIYREGGTDPPDWRVVFLDGRPDERIIPALDPRLSAGKGAAGMRLQVCDPTLDGACPGLLNGAVVGEAADGTVTGWYRDELAPDRVAEARFTRDGTAMWLLLDRRQGGRQFALARADAGQHPTEVMSAGLPSGDPGTYW